MENAYLVLIQGKGWRGQWYTRFGNIFLRAWRENSWAVYICEGMDSKLHHWWLPKCDIVTLWKWGDVQIEHYVMNHVILLLGMLPLIKVFLDMLVRILVSAGKFNQRSCCELFVGFWCSLGISTCSQSEVLNWYRTATSFLTFLYVELLVKIHSNIGRYFVGCAGCSCGVNAHSGSCSCWGMFCLSYDGIILLLLVPTYYFSWLVFIVSDLFYFCCS